MVLVARWRKRPPVLVVSVDHGLRPEAAAEARTVAENAARLGLPWRIMKAPKRRRGRQPAGLGAARALPPACRGCRETPASTRSSRRITRTTRPRRFFSGSRAAPASTGLRRCRRRDRRRDRACAAASLRAARGAARDRRGERPADRRGSEQCRSRASTACACARSLPDLARDRADGDAACGDGRAARPRRGGARPLCRRASEGALRGRSVRRRRAARASALATVPEEVALRTLALILKAVGGADYTPRLDAVEALRAAVLSAGRRRKAQAHAFRRRRFGRRRQADGAARMGAEGACRRRRAGRRDAPLGSAVRGRGAAAQGRAQRRRARHARSAASAPARRSAALSRRCPGCIEMGRLSPSRRRSSGRPRRAACRTLRSSASSAGSSESPPGKAALPR